MILALCLQGRLDPLVRISRKPAVRGRYNKNPFPGVLPCRALGSAEPGLYLAPRGTAPDFCTDCLHPGFTGVYWNWCRGSATDAVHIRGTRICKHCHTRVHAGARETLEVVLAHRLHRSGCGLTAANKRRSRLTPLTVAPRCTKPMWNLLRPEPFSTFAIDAADSHSENLIGTKSLRQLLKAGVHTQNGLAGANERRGDSSSTILLSCGHDQASQVPCTCVTMGADAQSAKIAKWAWSA